MRTSRGINFWNKQYDVVSGWVVSKGYKISCFTDADDRLEFEEKTIYINSRQHAESRFYTLLHECGHLLISQTASNVQIRQAINQQAINKYLPYNDLLNTYGNKYSWFY